MISKEELDMAGKKRMGSRKPARNPVNIDKRLDDLRFYWSRMTDDQQDRLYDVMAKLVEHNLAGGDINDDDMPRIVLYDPRSKTMS